MKCIGCGIEIQTQDENKPGYVKEIHLIEQGERVYCKRCYDVIHYNSRYIVPEETKNFYNNVKLDQKNNNNAIVMLMIDVLDIFGGFVNKVSHLVGKMPVIILVNKIDLLPRSIKLQHVETSTRMMAISSGLNVTSVFMISSKSKKNISDVLKKIDKLRFPKAYNKKPAFDNIYVVGCASVGKSTFINAVKEITSGENLEPLTTSDQFQTTLGIVKVDLGNKCYMIDTPGVINDQSFNAYLDYDSVRIVTPKSSLKVRTYQLRNEQTIFLGGLVRLDFVEGNNISSSFYVSNKLYIHRTKMSNADKLYQTRQFDLLVPPLTEDELTNLGKLTLHQLTLDDDQSFYDLIIPGIGFVHLRGNGVKINLIMSEKIGYRLLRSIV